MMDELYHLTSFLMYILRNRTPSTLTNTEKQMTHLRRCPQTKTSNLPRKARSGLKPPSSKWHCWTPLSSKEKLRCAYWKIIFGNVFSGISLNVLWARCWISRSFFPLLLFSSVGSIFVWAASFCLFYPLSAALRVDKTGKKKQRKGATLRAQRQGKDKAMLHISVMHR